MNDGVVTSAITIEGDTGQLPMGLLLSACTKAQHQAS